jgi:hypothetical protein
MKSHLINLIPISTMYDKDSKKDWLGGAVTAALGAGIVTSFAISRGQHPLLALGITAIAVTATLIIDHYLPKN